MGCYEVSLGDTVGKGTKEKTIKLIEGVTQFGIDKVAVHFHDTFDNAIENILTAVQMGKKIILF